MTSKDDNNNTTRATAIATITTAISNQQQQQYDRNDGYCINSNAENTVTQQSEITDEVLDNNNSGYSISNTAHRNEDVTTGAETISSPPLESNVPNMNRNAVLINTTSTIDIHDDDNGNSLDLKNNNHTELELITDNGSAIQILDPISTTTTNSVKDTTLEESNANANTITNSNSPEDDLLKTKLQYAVSDDYDNFPKYDQDDDEWSTASSLDFITSTDVLNSDDDDDDIKKKQQQQHDRRNRRRRRYEKERPEVGRRRDRLVVESRRNQEEANQPPSLLPSSTTFAVMNNIPGQDEIIKPGVSYIYPTRLQERRRQTRRRRSSTVRPTSSGTTNPNDDNESDYSSSSDAEGEGTNSNNNNNPSSDGLYPSSSSGTNITSGSSLPSIDFPTANEMEISLYNQQLQQLQHQQQLQQPQQQQDSHNPVTLPQDSSQPEQEQQQQEQPERQEEVEQLPNTDVVQNPNSINTNQRLSTRHIITTIAQPVVLPQQSQSLEQQQQTSHNNLFLQTQQRQSESGGDLEMISTRTRPSTTTVVRNTSLIIAEPMDRDEILRSYNDNTTIGNNVDDQFDNDIQNTDGDENKTFDDEKSSSCRHRLIKYSIHITCLLILVTSIVITFQQIYKTKGGDPVPQRKVPPPPEDRPPPNTGLNNSIPYGGNDYGNIFAKPDISIDLTEAGMNRLLEKPYISYHTVLIEANMGYCQNITTQPSYSIGLAGTTGSAQTNPNTTITNNANQMRVIIQCGNSDASDGKEYLKYQTASANVQCQKDAPNIIVCMASLNTIASIATAINSTEKLSSSPTTITRFSIVYSCGSDYEPPNITQSQFLPAYYQSTVETDYIFGTSCDPPSILVSNTTYASPSVQPHIKVSMNRLCGNETNNTIPSTWEFRSVTSNADSCPYSKWYEVPATSNYSSLSSSFLSSIFTTSNTSLTWSSADYYTYCEFDATCQKDDDNVNGTTDDNIICSFDKYSFYDDYNTSYHPECYNLAGPLIRYVAPDPRWIWDQIISIFKIINEGE